MNAPAARMPQPMPPQQSMSPPQRPPPPPHPMSQPMPQQQQQQQQFEMPPQQPYASPYQQPATQSGYPGYPQAPHPGYAAPAYYAAGPPPVEELALQQQMLALQMQTMQLQNSLEAKRAQRRRLLEQRRAEKEAAEGGGDQQQQLLQQVALQSMQLQTMMLKQMSQGGTVRAHARGNDDVSVAPTTLQPQPSARPNRRVADPFVQTSSVAEAAAAIGEQSAPEPSVDSSESAAADTVGASPVDNEPVKTMHQLAADEYDLDVVVPDFDLDEELGDYDGLAEIGITPAENEKQGKRSAIRRFRAGVWVLIFIHRTEKIAASKSSYSAEQVAPLFNVQNKVCTAWVKHVASPHVASIAADPDLSLDCQSVPDGGFAGVGGDKTSGETASAQQQDESKPGRRKFWSKSNGPKRHSPDEAAFIKLSIRTRRLLEDLHQGFFGTVRREKHLRCTLLQACSFGPHIDGNSSFYILCPLPTVTAACNDAICQLPPAVLLANLVAVCGCKC